MNLATRGWEINPVLSFQQVSEQAKKESRAVISILGSNDWLVIVSFDLNATVKITSHEWVHLARFDITIDNKEYTIGVAMDNQLVQRTKTITARTNPFLSNWSENLTSHSFVRTDIHPQAVLILFDKKEEVIITNDAFWSGIRKRIPSSHPLSLIQTI